MNMSETKLIFPSCSSLPIQPYGFPILRKSTVLLAPMLKSTGQLAFQILHSVPTGWNSTIPSSDIFYIVVLQVQILPPLFPNTVPSWLLPVSAHGNHRSRVFSQVLFSLILSMALDTICCCSSNICWPCLCNNYILYWLAFIELLLWDVRFTYIYHNCQTWWLLSP